jgi:hypothetical protein
MTPVEAVRTRLLSVVPVTTLVGTRIYQLITPQSPTYPLIRLQEVDARPDDTVDGETGILIVRVQIDAIAQRVSGGDTHSEATALADAIRGNGLFSAPSGLQHWRGDIGSPAYTVKGIHLIDRADRYEPEELRLVSIRQDYRVQVSAVA